VTDVRAFAARFIETVTSVEPFGAGIINETFLVQSPDHDFVLQRINRNVFSDVEGVMSNILAVHRHLDGLLVPEPVPSQRGEWLVYDGNDVWRAWKRVSDARPADDLTVASAASAGRLLGRFHRGLGDLDPATLRTTLPGFHDPGRRLAALRAAADADPCGRAATVTDEIAMAFAAAPLVELAAELTRRVPSRVAHNDAKLDNVLFRGGDAVCLVDLDTVMPGAWFWDVGDLLRTGSTTASEDDPHPEGTLVDPRLHRAILDGYRTGVAPIAEPAELEAIEIAGAIVTFEQAVRFLTDWIEGDVYYRTSRPGQNRDRARAQLRLLTTMPGTVTPL
jgi:Ser/Thr protein kinase RdoA (MazF antagonist)